MRRSPATRGSTHARLGATGGSYGGYMTNWIATHDAPRVQGVRHARRRLEPREHVRRDRGGLVLGVGVRRPVLEPGGDADAVPPLVAAPLGRRAQDAAPRAARASSTTACRTTRACRCSPRCSARTCRAGSSCSPTRATGSASRRTSSSGGRRCRAGSAKYLLPRGRGAGSRPRGERGAGAGARRRRPPPRRSGSAPTAGSGRSPLARGLAVLRLARPALAARRRRPHAPARRARRARRDSALAARAARSARAGGLERLRRRHAARGRRGGARLRGAHVRARRRAGARTRAAPRSSRTTCCSSARGDPDGLAVVAASAAGWSAWTPRRAGRRAGARVAVDSARALARGALARGVGARPRARASRASAVRGPRAAAWAREGWTERAPRRASGPARTDHTFTYERVLRRAPRRCASARRGRERRPRDRASRRLARRAGARPACARARAREAPMQALQTLGLRAARRRRARRARRVPAAPARRLRAARAARRVLERDRVRVRVPHAARSPTYDAARGVGPAVAALGRHARRPRRTVAGHRVDVRRAVRAHRRRRRARPRGRRRRRRAATAPRRDALGARPRPDRRPGGRPRVGARLRGRPRSAAASWPRRCWRWSRSAGAPPAAAARVLLLRAELERAVASRRCSSSRTSRCSRSWAIASSPAAGCCDVTRPALARDRAAGGRVRPHAHGADLPAAGRAVLGARAS